MIDNDYVRECYIRSESLRYRTEEQTKKDCEGLKIKVSERKPDKGEISIEQRFKKY